jgi:adenylylsulfate kinase
MVLWITGLSGAGKSTLAGQIALRMRARGLTLVLLDGDELREVFGAVSASVENHGRAGRLEMASRYARLCRMIALQKVHVVIATISMFREVHEWNRGNLPDYIEIYLKTPLDELRRRDPKGIYREYDAGHLEHVAGLDLEIDEPEAADWVMEFEPGRSVTSTADELMTFVEMRMNESGK